MAFLAGLATRLAAPVARGLASAVTSDSFKKAGGKAFEIVAGAAAGTALTNLFKGEGGQAGKKSITRDEFILGLGKDLTKEEKALLGQMFDAQVKNTGSKDGKLTKDQVTKMSNEIKAAGDDTQDKVFDDTDMTAIAKLMNSSQTPNSALKNNT